MKVFLINDRLVAFYLLMASMLIALFHELLRLARARKNVECPNKLEFLITQIDYLGNRNNKLLIF
jgi:hypothetical protein